MDNSTVTELIAAFKAEYGYAPQVVTRAPGRLEILGNHTDYNDGVVLSCAVDRATFVAAAECPGNLCRVKDIKNDTARSFKLDELTEPESGDWANYVKGIVVELQNRAVEVPAFDAVLLSTVPMAAGMSSSAALEISIAYAIGELAGVTFPWIEWAKMGQSCENNYVGAMTGLMDQFSSIRGQDGQLVFSDFRSFDVQNVPIPAGTALVIANCMVKHNLTGEYNERRQRCEEAVAVLRPKLDGITALRDVSREQLNAHKDALDPVTYRRALHVVGENERVIAGAQALENGDLETFGRFMFESHESSRVNFENSCDELDILVDIATSLPGAIGARLSGGGFGGTTIHLVKQADAETYANALRDAYKERTGLVSEVMICQAAQGAEVLQKPTAG